MMRQPVRRPKLIDAQQMARDYPDTFEAPSTEELAGIKPGFFVKVATVPKFDRERTERFWVEVVSVKHGKFIGRIDNDMVFTCWHDLNYRDMIKFEPRHIYNILPPNKTV